MSQYKLVYFDARGVAETTRFIFAYAGVPFEDHRIVREEWPSLKATTPFGQLPYLEVDGRQIGQSMAIARLLARKFGLAGKDEYEQAEVDAVADFQKDIQGAMMKWWREEDKEKQAQLREKFFNEDWKNYMECLAKHLKGPGKEFFAASGPTFADFSVACLLYTVKKFNPTVLDNFPQIAALVDRVHNLPGIKEWVEKRPKTEM